MSDEDTQAVNPSVEETNVDESPSSEEPTQDVEETQEDTSSAEPDATALEEGKEEDVKSSRRPSRLERRNQQLLEKLKEAQGKTSAKEGESTEKDILDQLLGGDSDQLLRPEDIRPDGTVDLKTLEERIQQRDLVTKEQIKTELRAEQQYRDSVQEHLTDVETVLSQPELDKDSDQYNAELDRLVTEQYELLNKATNPYTGKEEFKPQVKMSDLFAKFKNVVDKSSTSAAANASAKLAQQGDGVLRPSGKGDTGKNYEVESSYESAVQSRGDTESWASYLKKSGIAKL